MSEQNTKSLSVSFRMDDGIIDHNNREFIPKNVDAGRIQDNITYSKRNIREVYDELFGQALTEYNVKQKRADRKILNYYEHIKSDGRLKPFYEIVVQFGDIETCGLKSGKWEQAKLLLDDYMKDFESRNPNLKVFNAVMHLDEATPHLHIDFIPIAKNMRKGLPVKVILSILLYTIISKNRVFFWSTTNIHRAKRSEYWWCSGCMTEMVTQPRLVLRNNYAV